MCGVCGVAVPQQLAMETHTVETCQQLRHVTLVELLASILPWGITEFLLQEVVANLTFYVLVNASCNINVKFFAVHLCLETVKLAVIMSCWVLLFMAMKECHYGGHPLYVTHTHPMEVFLQMNVTSARKSCGSTWVSLWAVVNNVHGAHDFVAIQQFRRRGQYVNEMGDFGAYSIDRSLCLKLHMHWLHPRIDEWRLNCYADVCATCRLGLSQQGN